MLAAPRASGCRWLPGRARARAAAPVRVSGCWPLAAARAWDRAGRPRPPSRRRRTWRCSPAARGWFQPVRSGGLALFDLQVAQNAVGQPPAGVIRNRLAGLDEVGFDVPGIGDASCCWVERAAPATSWSSTTQRAAGASPSARSRSANWNQAASRRAMPGRVARCGMAARKASKSARLNRVRRAVLPGDEVTTLHRVVDPGAAQRLSRTTSSMVSMSVRAVSMSASECLGAVCSAAFFEAIFPVLPEAFPCFPDLDCGGSIAASRSTPRRLERGDLAASVTGWSGPVTLR